MIKDAIPPVYLETYNPATGEPLQYYVNMSDADVARIIERCQSAYQNWRQTSFARRKQLLVQFKACLAANSESVARLITTEMGKPITQARAEIQKCLSLCDYYAEHSAAILAPRVIATQYQKSYVSYQPLGIIFAIMPWNFPVWQVLRFLVPTLMAGNVGLLKPAPIVIGCAQYLEGLFREAGYPEDVFRALVINEAQASTVIQHPQIQGITLTGSQTAGSIVAAQAGKALKKVVLELGGSDPYLILADADLELAAEACVKSRLNNSGQVCVAAKRIIVVADIYQPFKEKLLEKAAAYLYSDPLAEDSQLGPLARADLREKLHQQVQASVAAGAKQLMGGYMPEGPGYYYPVTLLEAIPPNAPAYEDELFGPVICLFQVADERAAVAMANRSEFGLGAAIFTQDLAKGESLAATQLQAGACFVNAMVISDPRLPFGGIKSSGIGRELSEEGLREFTNIKTVCVA